MVISHHRSSCNCFVYRISTNYKHSHWKWYANAIVFFSLLVLGFHNMHAFCWTGNLYTFALFLSLSLTTFLDLVLGYRAISNRFERDIFVFIVFCCVSSILQDICMLQLVLQAYVLLYRYYIIYYLLDILNNHSRAITITYQSVSNC